MDTLAPELHLLVFRHLPYWALRSACVVCHHWGFLITNDEYLCKQLFKVKTTSFLNDGLDQSALGLGTLQADDNDKSNIRFHPVFSKVQYRLGEDIHRACIHGPDQDHARPLTEFEVATDFATIPFVTDMKVVISPTLCIQTAQLSRYSIEFVVHNPEGLRVIDIFSCLVLETQKKVDLLSILSGGSSFVRLHSGQSPAKFMRAELLGDRRKMPHYAPQDDDDFVSSSHFLAPSTSKQRKSLSRQSSNLHRRSISSLRTPSPLLNVIEDDSPNGLHHSLAHELAVALMPEPSAGSRLLAEEFGIEYDDGAEGIDQVQNYHDQHDTAHIVVGDTTPLSFADEMHAGSASDASLHDLPSESEDPSQDYDDLGFHNPATHSRKDTHHKEPEHDAMEILAQDLHSTDKFLGHLRILDVDPGSSAAQQPTLEKLASDVIRRMNDTVRSRETQVRELLECEREFRKIAGEVGGSDVLGQLDELEHLEDLSEPSQAVEPTKTEHRHHLNTLEEETTLTLTRSPSSHHQLQASDWELDPDRHRLGDEVDGFEPATSPAKDSFIPPPSIVGPPTPASAIPQLAHLRSCTTSLVSSLSTISEHAQVNGAATSEAGRKIRALKNKIGGWRTDWDSAERSRIRIERWEAGIGDGEDLECSTSPPTNKRTDGRRIVEEHLHAFELALADAALKTRYIMAR